MINIERKEEYKEYCQQLCNVANQIKKLKWLSKKTRRNLYIYTLPAPASVAQELTAPVLNILDTID
jgi:hypothetical protein